MINWKKFALKVIVIALIGLIYSNPSLGQANSSEMVIEIEHKVKKGKPYMPSARNTIAALRN